MLDSVRLGKLTSVGSQRKNFGQSDFEAKSSRDRRFGTETRHIGLHLCGTEHLASLNRNLTTRYSTRLFVLYQLGSRISATQSRREYNVDAFWPLGNLEDNVPSPQYWINRSSASASRRDSHRRRRETTTHRRLRSGSDATRQRSSSLALH